MFERIKNTTCFIRNSLRLTSARYFLEESPVQEGSAPEAGGELFPAPEVGIILGSGLGALADRIEVLASLDYADIPGFPRSTVPGHRGQYLYGRLGGKPIIAMQGRVHYYEGYPIQEVVLPVRAMCCLGINTLIVSNAAGGLSPLFKVGDLMVIDDHINRLPNPLVGPNLEQLGPRFPDMSEAYDRRLIALAHAEALVLGIPLRQGCYVGSSGPTFETPAEYRLFRSMGADATGMSTTPEVIVARHQGVRVLGFSLISNVGIDNRIDRIPAGRLNAYGDDETDFGVGSHAEVIEAGEQAGPLLSRLVEAIIEKV